MRDGDIIVRNLNDKVGVSHWKFELHITKKLLEPNNFLGGANKGTVLGVSAIESNTSLLFTTPGNTKIP
jgi:hypothetical protein